MMPNRRSQIHVFIAVMQCVLRPKPLRRVLPPMKPVVKEVSKCHPGKGQRQREQEMVAITCGYRDQWVLDQRVNQYSDIKRRDNIGKLKEYPAGSIKHSVLQGDL
jgi:hypothetical protein